MIIFNINDEKINIENLSHDIDEINLDTLTFDTDDNIENNDDDDNFDIDLDIEELQ